MFLSKYVYKSRIYGGINDYDFKYIDASNLTYLSFLNFNVKEFSFVHGVIEPITINLSNSDYNSLTIDDVNADYTKQFNLLKKFDSYYAYAVNNLSVIVDGKYVNTLSLFKNMTALNGKYLNLIKNIANTVYVTQLVNETIYIRNPSINKLIKRHTYNLSSEIFKKKLYVYNNSLYLNGQSYNGTKLLTIRADEKLSNKSINVNARPVLSHLDLIKRQGFGLKKVDVDQKKKEEERLALIVKQEKIEKIKQLLTDHIETINDSMCSRQFELINRSKIKILDLLNIPHYSYFDGRVIKSNILEEEEGKNIVEKVFNCGDASVFIKNDQDIYNILSPNFHDKFDILFGKVINFFTATKMVNKNTVYDEDVIKFPVLFGVNQDDVINSPIKSDATKKEEYKLEKIKSRISEIWENYKILCFTADYEYNKTCDTLNTYYTEILELKNLISMIVYLYFYISTISATIDGPAKAKKDNLQINPSDDKIEVVYTDTNITTKRNRYFILFTYASSLVNPEYKIQITKESQIIEVEYVPFLKELVKNKHQTLINNTKMFGGTRDVFKDKYTDQISLLKDLIKPRYDIYEKCKQDIKSKKNYVEKLSNDDNFLNIVSTYPTVDAKKISEYIDAYNDDNLEVYKAPEFVETAIGIMEVKKEEPTKQGARFSGDEDSESSW